MTDDRQIAVDARAITAALRVQMDALLVLRREANAFDATYEARVWPAFTSLNEAIAACEHIARYPLL